jgi:putative acetyltransferase
VKAAGFEIRADDLSGPEITALLQEHVAAARQHSPVGCAHALDLSALRAPGITFWSVWEGARLAGCGALKQLDARHAEIKSMRTATPFLRRGVATALLAHMQAVARQRGYRRISLETGRNEHFAAARALYARFGFTVCGPFAGYVDNAFSVFMTRELAP